MKFFLLFLAFTFLCNIITYSQEFILRKRNVVKEKMNHLLTKQHRGFKLLETETGLTYSINDSITLPFTKFFYFNNINRCYIEETSFNCDSCLNKALNFALKLPFHHWITIKENEMHYARYPYNTLLQKVKSGDNYILRSSYKRIKRKDLKKM